MPYKCSLLFHFVDHQQRLAGRSLSVYQVGATAKRHYREDAPVVQNGPQSILMSSANTEPSGATFTSLNQSQPPYKRSHCLHLCCFAEQKAAPPDWLAHHQGIDAGENRFPRENGCLVNGPQASVIQEVSDYDNGVCNCTPGCLESWLCVARGMRPPANQSTLIGEGLTPTGLPPFRREPFWPATLAGVSSQRHLSPFAQNIGLEEKMVFVPTTFNDSDHLIR
ncbi:unnamed protein product [Protopolystoma xenopodis]|uniref:Uncharacterized protein n=1 Tax=Protopolystoma xenopodis TaxID=117903 RepID=A0A3S5ANR7_9PLAT|nr:unnamed protein product [Protopolystoma xenopodis]